MHRFVSRVSRNRTSPFLQQFVPASSISCEQHLVSLRNDESLGFFKGPRSNLSFCHTIKDSLRSGSLTTNAEIHFPNLDQIFEDNKCQPELVNHNLYNLLLEEDLIRSAHQNLVLAARAQKDFYERRGLVRDIVKELQGEKFQFTSSLQSKKQEGEKSLFEPTPFRDRIVLEAMRTVLERVYEPIFLDTSHGFRPCRSRHTALQSVRRGLRNHKVALVGKLRSQDFDFHVLVKLLENKIGDKRFIRLIWKALKAGHGNRKHHIWTVKSTWDGQPEVMTLSTLLTNIYFHNLDCWIREWKQKFDRRAPPGTLDPQRLNLTSRITRLKREGKLARIKLLSARRAQLANRGQNLFSRQIFYVRYVDELLISFITMKGQVLSFSEELEEFLKHELKLNVPEMFELKELEGSHALFLGTKISISNASTSSQSGRDHWFLGRVRLEAPMDKIIEELAKLRMVSRRGTRPHPVTFLARCSHNEIICYYNWIMRGCSMYYSFVDNFYQLMSYLRLAIRSSCVRTLTMKLKRYRSARTYKDFGTECAARYRVPVKNGKIVDDHLSDEERSILKDRIRAAQRLRPEWEYLGAIEKGLLHRFLIPKRIQEPNGDINLEFRGQFLLYCSKKSEHEETKRALRKLELLPPAQNIWDFKKSLEPPSRPRLSIDHETLYPF